MTDLAVADLLALRPRLAAKTKLRLDPKTGKYILLYPEKGLLLNPTGAAILADIARFAAGHPAHDDVTIVCFGRACDSLSGHPQV